jgi:hydroxymethylglutaryl-CoA synthase
MREALEDYESVTGDIELEDFVYAPFHTPFPGMVRKAALLAYRHVIRDTEHEDSLADEIGRQPREGEFDDREAYEEAIRGYMDDLKTTEQYRTWYDTAVEPTLELSREVGNWYTSSVHIARVSALRDALIRDEEFVGDTLLVASYGSGAQAEIHAETVREGWREEIEDLDIDDQLDARYDLSWEEYEDIHDVHEYDADLGREVEELTQPDGEFVFTGWGRMNERQYEYVE